MAVSWPARLFWFFSGLGALYSIILGLLTTPWLQRQALYAHKFHTAWWHDISKPESFGFAKDQVTALNITTPDGETLFAWHVLPLGLYARNHAALQAQAPVSSFEDSLSYRLLREDQNANLVISFHGNAGHVAEGERPAVLRALAALPATSNGGETHVLTFDYRGFGKSSGSPTEEGLIVDALAVLEAAKIRLGVPAERTALFATSLGTAVVAGALDALNNSTSSKKGPGYAGVVLTGAFESLATLLPTYAIAGVLPVLGPVAAYKRVADYLISSLVDTWQSGDRWTRLCAAAAAVAAAGGSQRLALHVLHARNDHDIAWPHADWVYEACLAGLHGGGAAGTQAAADARAATDADLEARPGWRTTGRGQGLSGHWSRSFTSQESVGVRETITEHGGHNAAPWHAPALLAVWELLDGQAPASW